ncbi:Stromal cell-derived factor 2-like protein [Clonorchis sinensis]|uniref:Stromal cell-derived factor 2-like protein n=1 Tax=Clonorchis sinensis TaxID=79923 RepID=A0A8T1MQC6_CLOSI|nr:Stromal cell-derived factor 2-like protein [Clonorchis sinensis]
MCGLLQLLVVVAVITVSDASEKQVTCGSVFKLVHPDLGIRLHSHEVQYGSGSGQQSVTGVKDAIDGNSYWQVLERNGSPQCIRGRVIKCGQKVRLLHVSTRKFLHSHHFQSPLSGNYEVSAFGEDGVGDEGDDWQVLCDGPHWLRSSRIRLKHISTEGYLHVSGRQYNRPITGQYEISAISRSSGAAYWEASEGVYLKPTQSSAHQNDSGVHDEL